MRILLLLILLTYWLTHPAAVHALVHLAALALGALVHAGGAHAHARVSAHGALLALGSHWN